MISASLYADTLGRGLRGSDNLYKRMVFLHCMFVSLPYMLTGPDHRRTTGAAGTSDAWWCRELVIRPRTHHVETILEDEWVLITVTRIRMLYREGSSSFPTVCSRTGDPVENRLM